MLPLKRLGEGVYQEQEYESQDHFQFVVTTEPNTISWDIMRTIEAVFYFHPNAKVTIHSNSISARDSNLDIFAEAGYNFEIKPYSFEQLFESASYLSQEEKGLFLDRLEMQSKQQHWYTHEADLVKLLVLERNGGVMMDTDMHLVKPLPKSFTNVAAWRDEKNEKIGTAMLMLEKHNPFLQEVLKDAIDISNNHYNRGKSLECVKFSLKLRMRTNPYFSSSCVPSSSDWYDIFGQDLFSEHFLRTQKGTKDIQVLTHELFYPFEIEDECFTMNKEIHEPIDEKFTFAVHMKPKPNMQAPMSGSLCEELLMEHCIFCGELVVQKIS